MSALRGRLSESFRFSRLPFLVGFFFTPMPAHGFQPHAEIYATAGGRWINPSNRHTDGAAEFGAMARLGGRTWLVLPCAHYARTRVERDSDIETTSEITTQEVGLGLTHLWKLKWLRPYLAGGWERTTVETRSVDPPNDRVFRHDLDGAWLGVGATIRLAALVHLGVGGRAKTAITSRDDVPVWSAAGLVGVAWPE